MNVYEVLKKPVITEKNTMLMGEHKYTFEIHRDANKMQVKEAVEKIFNVDVLKVNVINVPGKMRRVGRSRGMTSERRKAVVTIKPDQRIEVFEGA